MKTISIAFVFTKYQYNILLLTLEKLKLEKKDIFLIISSKAKKQMKNSSDFYATYYYDENNESMKNWLGLKNKIYNILNQIKDFNIENIFLRNYNATISRVLMSKYKEAHIYLIEEGVPSYLKDISFLTLPNSNKEKIKTLITRFYFSKGLIRILPFYKSKLIKVGFSESMKPWLNVPFLKIELSEIIVEDKNILSIPSLNYKVLILDQPLWQVGLSKVEYYDLYNKVIEYILSLGYALNEIAIKPHPSTSLKDLEAINNIRKDESTINIISNSYNIEELLIAKKLNTIEYYIGFFSWSLAVINFNTNKNIIAIYSKKLLNTTTLSYQLLKNLKIKLKEIE